MPGFQDQLTFDYDNLAGFRGRVLGFSKACVQMAFPEADIRTAHVHSYGRDQEVLAIHVKGDDDPAFYIDQGGGIWNQATETSRQSFHAYTLFVRHNSATILGRYKVNETRFEDFQDVRIGECDFWIDGSKFICMGDAKGGYRTRFIFSPPEGFEGDFGKAPKEVLRKAVLTEARFYFAGERERTALNIPDVFSETEATAQMKTLISPKPKGLLGKLIGGNNSAKMLDSAVTISPHSGPVLDPLETLQKSRFSPSDARKAYIALADLAIYETDAVAVKAEIKKIFKGGDQEAAHYLQAISCMDIGPGGAFASFILSFDWKQEVQNFTHVIEAACNRKVSDLNLPNSNEFIQYASISSPNVLERYQTAMNEVGLDLNFLDSGGDTWMFLITPVKNRKRVRSLLSIAEIM